MREATQIKVFGKDREFVMTNHLMNTYGRQPVTFTKGEGVWLTVTHGNRYLDALSGVAVNGLGHAHPKFVAALNEQIGRLIHVSNIYQIAEQDIFTFSKKFKFLCYVIQ